MEFKTLANFIIILILVYVYYVSDYQKCPLVSVINPQLYREIEIQGPSEHLPVRTKRKDL